MQISQLAKKLGKNKSTVSRHARRLKLGRRVGRDVLLTPAEAEKVAAAIVNSRVGNPNFRLRKELKNTGK